MSGLSQSKVRLPSVENSRGDTMTKRVESLLRILGYTILLASFLYLAMSVRAQTEVNREARYQKWLLISLELADVNAATDEWNSAVKRYKKLDDINAWELQYALRKAQVANAKIDEYLSTLDEPIGYSKEIVMKEFRCECGVLVITNDQKRTQCTSCETKNPKRENEEDYPPDRFSDH